VSEPVDNRYLAAAGVELDFEVELDLSELADDELDDFSVEDDVDFSAGLSDDFSDFSVDAGVEVGDSLPLPEPLLVLFADSRLSLR
jgi:hypothetical protein